VLPLEPNNFTALIYSLNIKTMRQIVTLTVLFCSLAFYASAQNMSRIVAAQTDRYNGTAWVPYDSTIIMYKSGNNTPGDADSFQSGTGIGLVLKNDTSILMTYYTGSYYNLYRHTLTYDAQGYLLVHLWEQPVSVGSSTWKNHSRETYTYDGSHNRTELVTENWNGTTSSWDKNVRYVYTYSSNNLTNELSQSWYSSTSSWENINEWQMTYTGSNLTTKIFRVWDAATSAFKNYGKDDYTYFPNNNLQTDLYQLWYAHLGNWRNYSKTDHIWNVTNVDSVVTGMNWDTIGTAWKNAWRYRYVFDMANKVKGDTTENWNVSGSNWVYSNVGTSVNDTSYFRFVWDVLSSMFKNSERATTSYNQYGQMTRWISERWNSGTSAWGINNDADRKYYYQLTGVNVKDVSAYKPELKIYPSPADKYITLDIKQAKPADLVAGIYNAEGRLVMQWSEPAGTNIHKTIPVADLSTGVYFINVRSKNATTTEQFIIAR
jgi:hypothetical protein